MFRICCDCERKARQTGEAKLKSYTEACLSPWWNEPCSCSWSGSVSRWSRSSDCGGNLPASVATMRTKRLSVAVFILCAKYRNSEWQRGQGGGRGGGLKSSTLWATDRHKLNLCGEIVKRSWVKQAAPVQQTTCMTDGNSSSERGPTWRSLHSEWKWGRMGEERATGGGGQKLPGHRDGVSCPSGRADGGSILTLSLFCWFCWKAMQKNVVWQQPVLHLMHCYDNHNTTSYTMQVLDVQK